MRVLNAFLSTWTNARTTFGEGAPQTGAQYDSGGKLAELNNIVNSAAPDGRWTGTASAAYGDVNQEHGRVLGRMADLDQRLGAQVDQSSRVVAAGREDLDAVRKWVLDAAASVPPGVDHERMLMPIVQRGLGEIVEIVQKSNGELNAIGTEIQRIGGEYRTLGIQKQLGGKESK
jgi:hypothetical protein